MVEINLVTHLEPISESAIIAEKNGRTEQEPTISQAHHNLWAFCVSKNVPPPPSVKLTSSRNVGACWEKDFITQVIERKLQILSGQASIQIHFSYSGENDLYLIHGVTSLDEIPLKDRMNALKSSAKLPASYIQFLDTHQVSACKIICQHPIESERLKQILSNQLILDLFFDSAFEGDSLKEVDLIEVNEEIVTQDELTYSFYIFQQFIASIWQGFWEKETFYVNRRTGNQAVFKSHIEEIVQPVDLTAVICTEKN